MLQLFELPPGPESAVLPAPAISQGLRLCHGSEQLGVEVLIPEPAVERLSKTVLPRRSGLDVSRGGTAAAAPAP
jgi:hypothetical protein